MLKILLLAVSLAGSPAAGPFDPPFPPGPIPAPVSAGFIATGPTHAGETITVDLPETLHMKNKGGLGPLGPGTGAGLCVFTSIEHGAKYQNIPALLGLQAWMTKKPGGGYPDKVAKILPEFCASVGKPVPDYVQHTGGDMEFLRLALRTGRFVSVTYAGRDGVFYFEQIAHMVNLVHLSERWAVILDNNNPGKYLWMPPAAFRERWVDMNGGWAVVLVGPPPSPIPTNSPKRATVELDPEQIADTWTGPLSSNGVVRAPSNRPDVVIEEFDEPKENYGVEISRIRNTPAGTGTDYSVNGVACSRREAFRAVFGVADLKDDRNKPFVTIHGDDALRARVRQDIDTHPALAPWKPKVHVQDYPLDHWDAKRVGIAPGISLQRPADANGASAVVWRFREYTGPVALAEALRKADPNYQPNGDPDPTAPPTPVKPIPSPPNGGPPAAGGAVMWAGCFGVFLMAWLKTRRAVLA